MILNVDLLKASGRIFDGQPDPTQYFPTTAMDAVREQLHARLQKPSGVVALTGPSGAGKTLMVRAVLADLPGHWAHVAHLAYTSMSGSEILQSVVYGFGMPRDQAHGVPSLIRWLEGGLDRWAAAGETSLLVIDEAHHLPMSALRPLLALATAPAGQMPRLSLLLAGHPELADLLAQAMPNAATNGMVGTVPLRMPTFQAAETAAFVAGRMERLKASGAPEFSPQVIAEVHRCAQGRPGRVNALCQQLVHNAALDEAARSLTPGSVLAMAGELGYGVPPIDAPVEPVEPVVSAPAPAAQPAQARRRWGLIATVVAAIVAIGGTALFAALQFAPGGRKAEATIATQPSASVVPAASAPAPVAAQSVQASSEPAKPSALAEASASPPPSPLLRAESQSGAGAEPSPPLPASSPALSLVEGPPAALASAGAAPATVSPKPVRRSPNASPAPAAQSISRAAAADCARLLSQLSLGEPLTATQQHTFRSICR